MASGLTCRAFALLGQALPIAFLLHRSADTTQTSASTSHHLPHFCPYATTSVIYLITNVYSLSLFLSLSLFSASPLNLSCLPCLQPSHFQQRRRNFLHHHSRSCLVLSEALSCFNRPRNHHHLFQNVYVFIISYVLLLLSNHQIINRKFNCLFVNASLH